MATDRKSRYLASVYGLGISLGVAFLVMLIMIFIMSKAPMQTLYYFFVGPLMNKYYLGNMLNAAAPLILTGLGISFAFKSSMFNLGGEGQVYVGGLAATAVCLMIPEMSAVIGIPLSLAAALGAGALVAGLSGYFKYKWKTDELISTFLISNALIFIVDNLITGVLHDPESSLLVSRKIAEQFWFLKILLPSNLNISILFILLLAVLAYFYLFKTHQGYEMRITGLSPEFARYGGINVKKYFLIPMVLSGGLHGLAGAVSVMGTQHMLFKGFSGGMGWNGIAVALIARNHPIAVIPAALFFAYIEAGAKSAMINSDVTMEIAAVVQAVVFYLITAKVIQDLAARRSVKV
ncbi:MULTISPECIES: ABC transporter permease [unclassified Oceanispirochaeta]|uniref:ABC transporter permease n=1 Tax=unclassified Oceanispirochaeta TaxID=2635722 RepID=UPI0013145252|nr:MULTISPECIES: ABC transporter permease [unclassified Oceanispirochaeta]MBF9018129.1 ABC transporter permease [Oceanispirochaeta sp. M2]NPD74593.1 ABC transporter permease [Oceanispirochaeta sp. M1]